MPLIVSLAATCAVVVFCASPAIATFPGGNGLIAFQRGTVIATIDPVTKQITDLVPGQSPAWSADGKRIVFYFGSGNSEGIYVMKADGSDITQLTFRTSGEPDQYPSWSPNGKHIVFQRCSFDTGGGCDIYTMRSDGTGLVQLTYGGLSQDAVYSPDGTRIAFDSIRTGNGDIYVMDRDGTHVVQLTSQGISQIGPDWSPDGSKIAFFTTNAVGLRGDIWVMNADGSNQVNLTMSSHNEQDPVWSPDGSQLAFQAGKPGQTQIFVMNINGSGAARLTSDPIPGDVSPDWQAI